MRETGFIIVSIIAFSYVVISIMIYVGIARLKEKLDNKKLEEVESKFGKVVLEHLDKTFKGEDIKYRELKVVRDALSTPLYFKVFSKKYIEYANNKDITSARKYILNFEKKIIKVFIRVDKKSIMRFAYYIYLVGEFRIKNNIINKVLLENLNTQSIYVRVNALKALSKIGDLESFLDALRIISLRGLYFNEKIVIDSIDSFEWDQEELNSKLIEEMQNFTPEMTNIIITHFSNIEYRQCSRLLIEKLKDNNIPKEVVIRIVKYFERVKNPEAQPLIISLLDNESWEVRAVASKAMLKYDVEKSKDRLRSLVSDNNYYVRYNSAMTLISKGKDYKPVMDIISGEDKYARDIMFYAMFTKNFINYDEYVRYTKDHVNATSPLHEVIDRKVKEEVGE